MKSKTRGGLQIVFATTLFAVAVIGSIHLLGAPSGSLLNDLGEQEVVVNCPKDADKATFEEAKQVIKERNGFFDDGCVMYHGKDVNKVFYLQVSE